MRIWIAGAALAGFIAVALGAMASHGLRDSLAPERLEWLDTATRYALWHALALMGVALFGLVQGESASFALRVAAWAFALGLVLFSGSLTAMAFGAPRALGAIVPWGGVGFLVGWAALAFAALRG